MEQKYQEPMSQILKLIIPLLDDYLTLADISKECGFVNAFYYNKNKPFLDNHTFLMYDLKNTSKEAYEREKRLRNCKNIFSKEIIQIKGNYYLLYTFCNVNPDIKECQKGYIPKHKENSIKILKFWNNTDEFINNMIQIVCPKRAYLEFESVPEVDYQNEGFWWLNTISGAVA